MSIATTETTITHKYLMSKTKDEIADHVMRLRAENDKLKQSIEGLVEAAVYVERSLAPTRDQDNGYYREVDRLRAAIVGAPE